MPDSVNDAIPFLDSVPSDSRDLFINLAASLIWAVVGAIFYRFAVIPLRRTRSSLSRTLPFDMKQPISICYGLIPPGPGTVYYSVAEGDLSAINYASNTLASMYGVDTVRTYSFHTTEMLLGDLTNILSISGPKWNRVTELMMGRLGVPFAFDETDGLIVRHADGQSTTYRAERSPTGDERICYGFVCGGDIQTPAGKRQHVVICAGLNTLSTYGAVVFLMSLREHFSLRRNRRLTPGRRGSRWGIVLRVENTAVRDDDAGSSRNPMDSDHIQLDMIDTLPDHDFNAPFVYRF